ncbi:macoilin-1-like [Anopheles cruzii]|uniref:macoilin-1-like n=1 Tax=Anopheles cruzii TaxID=68878 RepID=UPI0022EC7C6C|nr:macoilin-1-like [Anopheles cruzii]
MKRRNADCGKIRRPIKKNKIAEQIGSNTLLYVKFLLLWASVITADFLLEFRFEFLWPFWLLLRSVYDSFKYKGLAFSVLFVCIAITSDLVCLFFIPVQWLFFAASTYVWVQYVWHTDKGICLPTIILWILFVYLEAAIRWKDSRNIPHLDLCRPFAAHCIGYPVVTLGFGFKSYVGYCIRQRKQREVAKDNDFYMQLLQEALPKDESTLLDQVPGDGSSGTGSEQQLQKDLIVVTATTTSITASAVSMSGTLLNSMNTSSSSTASSSRSDAGQNHHHHHPHNHHNQHHHNHQQQQQQPNTHSKSAQNHKSPSNSTVSTSHVNGHVSSGSSPSVNTSAMNGGLNHQPSSGQGSSKHRKSLDKDSSSTSSSASSTSNGSVKGSNGGAGGGSGNFSYHQAIATFPQSNGATGSTASSVAATVTASSTKEISVSGAPQRGNDHGSNHVTSGPTVKDTKESPSAASVGQNRKDSDKEATGSSVTTPPTGVRSANGVANRSKSPADGPSPCTGKAVGKQVNGHVPNLEPSQVQPPNAAPNGLNGESSPVTVPVMEAKSSRSGRKNRLKQQQKAADQANISTIAKIFATLGLASTVTTLTTATTSTASGSSTTNSANFGGTTSTTATDCGAVPGSKDGREDGAGGVPSGHESSASARGASGNTQQSTPDAGDAAQSKPPANGPPVPSSPTVVMVQKACETCPRLEGDLKKVRAEVAAHRQAENELRQKYDTTASNLKGCLQAKQKDCDELQSRYQELSNQRQQERQSLQTVERRLGEERRLRQSLESQLGNERKHRKLAEERVSRGECSEACMAKKRQMQLELEKLKHELLSSEESKHLAEKQTRSFEQEMRKFEVQLRNRESQQNTDVLMSALAAMQDKNATLEKSLSAETRVKLDLFSALGGARREVDILTCSLRSKENEILDLNAKIVELVAVMPTMPDDTLCLTGPVGSGTGQDGGPSASMMRLPDAPQLLPQPLSGGLNGVGGAGSGGTGQQPSPMSHMVLNGQPLIGQLGGGLGVLTSTMTTVSSSNSVCPPPGVTLASLASGAGSGGGSVGQLVQMQSTNQGNGNCPSGLDPNATVYTPKNNGMVGGTEA